MLIVLGSVLARSDTVEEVQRLSRAHVERSRLEPGCLSHAVQVDLDEPRRLVFIEHWADWAALQAHFRVPASAAFARDMARLGAAPPGMTVYEATARQGPQGATR
jgi:quinol monooxygenase YgiN